MADKQTDQKLFMILGEGEETPTARATAHYRKAFTDENRALAIRVGQAKFISWNWKIRTIRVLWVLAFFFCNCFPFYTHTHTGFSAHLFETSYQKAVKAINCFHSLG